MTTFEAIIAKAKELYEEGTSYKFDDAEKSAIEKILESWNVKAGSGEFAPAAEHTKIIKFWHDLFKPLTTSYVYTDDQRYDGFSKDALIEAVAKTFSLSDTEKTGLTSALKNSANASKDGKEYYDAEQTRVIDNVFDFLKANKKLNDAEHGFSSLAHAGYIIAGIEKWDNIADGSLLNNGYKAATSPAAAAAVTYAVSIQAMGGLDKALKPAGGPAPTAEADDTDTKTKKEGTTMAITKNDKAVYSSYKYEGDDTSKPVIEAVEVTVGGTAANPALQISHKGPAKKVITALDVLKSIDDNDQKEEIGKALKEMIVKHAGANDVTIDDVDAIYKILLARATAAGGNLIEKALYGHALYQLPSVVEELKKDAKVGDAAAQAEFTTAADDADAGYTEATRKSKIESQGSSLRTSLVAAEEVNVGNKRPSPIGGGTGGGVDRHVQELQGILKLYSVAKGEPGYDPGKIDGARGGKTSNTNKAIDKVTADWKRDYPDDVRLKGGMTSQEFHHYLITSLGSDKDFRKSVYDAAVTAVTENKDKEMVKAAQATMNAMLFTDGKEKPLTVDGLAHRKDGTVARTIEASEKLKTNIPAGEPAPVVAPPPPAAGAAPGGAPAPAPVVDKMTPPEKALLALEKKEGDKVSRGAYITASDDRESPLSLEFRTADDKKPLTSKEVSQMLLNKLKGPAADHAKIDDFLKSYIKDEAEGGPLTSAHISGIYDRFKKLVNDDAIDPSVQAIYSYALSRIPGVVSGLDKDLFENDAEKENADKIITPAGAVANSEKDLKKLAGITVAPVAPAVPVEDPKVAAKREADAARSNFNNTTRVNSENMRWNAWEQTRGVSERFTKEKDRKNLGAENDGAFYRTEGSLSEKQRQIGIMHIAKDGTLVYMYKDDKGHVRTMDFTDERNDVSGKNRLTGLHNAMFSDDVVAQANEAYQRSLAVWLRDHEGGKGFEGGLGIVKDIKETHLKNSNYKLHILDSNCDGKITRDEVHLVTNDYIQLTGQPKLQSAYAQTPEPIRQNSTSLSLAASSEMLNRLGLSEDYMKQYNMKALYNNAAVGAPTSVVSENGGPQVSVAAAAGGGGGPVNPKPEVNALLDHIAEDVQKAKAIVNKPAN